MALEIRPGSDRGETVRLTLCEERRELVVTADRERTHYRLRDDAPDRLGWVERRLEQGLVRRRRVSAGDVACACLREWDAEQRVQRQLRLEPPSMERWLQRPPRPAETHQSARAGR
jgi:hypothetical protein